MSRRILILCRSNHDPVAIGDLACKTLLKRAYSYDKDYIRWAGIFDESKTQPTKCHVILDCDVASHDGVTEIPLVCYKAISKDQLTSVIPPKDLPHRIRAGYAWGRRGPP
ncbi:uncharacterized protein EKO05_0008178 [Ascochyta rabiei]|uniref:uncharacterized protein n=1 Tax=Didymella rabiei TaxID=5454 RepID=UPI00220BF33E|nr:uncharacterized protein EKO05_0008178 [Ascochyta rabiei]UPX17851.1 hypothetical protein EKO05_0008178 [Ascochyta rabiei]